MRQRCTLLGVGAYTLAALVAAAAVLACYARFFLGNQIPLAVPVLTANGSEIAGLNESIGSYRTVEVLVRDPSLTAGLLLAGSVIVSHGLLVLACVLLGRLVNRLRGGERLFTRATSNAMVLFGVAAIALPALSALLDAAGTGRALTDGGATPPPQVVDGALDYVRAPDALSSLLQSETAFGLIVGLFLVAVGIVMRRATQMANELEDVV